MFIHTPEVSNELPRGSSEFSRTVEYINSTGRSLTVLERNGIPSVIPTRNTISKDGKLHVTVKYRFTDRVLFNTIHVVGDESNPERDMFEASLPSAKMVDGMRESRIVYNIALADIEPHVTVHVKALDILVSTITNDSIPRHPGSSVSFTEQLAERVALSGASFGITLVDNNELFPPGYINMHGKIIQINKFVSNEIRPGYYVTWVTAEGTNTEHYSINDVAKIPVFIYPTYEDAIEGEGDEKLAKLKLLRVEAKLRAVEAEDAMLRIDHKRHADTGRAYLDGLVKNEKLFTERMNARYELESDIDEIARKETDNNAKLVLEHDKGVRDVASSTSKNVSDSLKLIPAVLGIITAIITLRNKK